MSKVTEVWMIDLDCTLMINSRICSVKLETFLYIHVNEFINYYKVSITIYSGNFLIPFQDFIYSTGENLPHRFNWSQDFTPC